MTSSGCRGRAQPAHRHRGLTGPLTRAAVGQSPVFILVDTSRRIQRVGGPFLGQAGYLATTARGRVRLSEIRGLDH